MTKNQFIELVKFNAHKEFKWMDSEASGPCNITDKRYAFWLGVEDALYRGNLTLSYITKHTFEYLYGYMTFKNYLHNYEGIE